ncbi:MAG: MarR family transcriptional regulator [bacterium]|nr:MarR family transcriptional regulator [bacterium]
MPTDPQIRQEFIQDFGEGYLGFGLPKLMGRIVGLLLLEEEALSLDQIADYLQVSKGPISQITRRLSERGLIRKVWVPGSRRDHYVAEDEIFARAFATHADLLDRNRLLAAKYNGHQDESGGERPNHFARRVHEMQRFYELMGEHLGRFLEQWRHERSTMISTWHTTEDSAATGGGNDGGSA